MTAANIPVHGTALLLQHVQLKIVIDHMQQCIDLCYFT